MKFRVWNFTFKLLYSRAAASFVDAVIQASNAVSSIEYETQIKGNRSLGVSRSGEHVMDVGVRVKGNADIHCEDCSQYLNMSPNA